MTSSGPADFVIVGTEPMALFLAAELHLNHARQVTLVTTLPDPLRLATGLDLALPCATRPAFLRQVRNNRRGVERTLARIGASAALKRTDPLLIASNANARSALGMIAHMAALSGIEVDCMVAHPVEPDAKGYLFRDIQYLERSGFSLAWRNWSESGKITTRKFEETAKADLTFSAGENVAEEAPAKTQTVLVGSAAMDRFARKSERGHFTEIAGSGLLIEAGSSLPQGLTIDLDTGWCAHAPGDGGAQIFCNHGLDAAREATRQYLGPDGFATVIGETEFPRYLPAAGFPVCRQEGRQEGKTSVTLIAGFGWAGFFMVPTLARFLTGQCDVDETRLLQSVAPRIGQDGRETEFIPGYRT